MVFGFLPLVILAAIPTASVKRLGVKVKLPGGFFKLKHKVTCTSTSFVGNFTTIQTPILKLFTGYLPLWLSVSITAAKAGLATS